MERARTYLGLFIIDPGKEGAIEEVHAGIKKILGDHSGTVVEENKIGKKQLSYPIKKKAEGIYYKLTFTALPSSIEKISRLYRIDTNILRALIDKKEEKANSVKTGE